MRKKYVMILLAGMLAASTLMTACGGGNTATTAAATEAVTTAAAATTEAVAETEAETTAAAAEEKSALGEAIDLDKQDPPKHDFSRANRLPMTGYMTKSFEDGRSIKVYISKEAPIRPYFTIVAVPDGAGSQFGAGCRASVSGGAVYVDGICLCIAAVGISIFRQYPCPLPAADCRRGGGLLCFLRPLSGAAGVPSFPDGAPGRPLPGILHRLPV